MAYVRAVLQRLLQHRLYLKLEKCSFHASRVSFLGHVFTKGRLAMDDAKVRAIREWPVPTSVKEVQRFLGFANFYRRFIRDFGVLALPLTELTRKSSRPFVMSPPGIQAFRDLQHRFTTGPILRLPDPAFAFRCGGGRF